MKIAVGSDHAGFELKELVRPLLEEGGHEVVDVGTDSEESTDYPRHAADAARMVAEGEAERAVIVCGSGVGVSIVANKVDGVRAVNAHDPEEAEMSRRHNNANVLALAGRRLTPDEARPIVETFLADRLRGRAPRAPRRSDRRGRARREALSSCSPPARAKSLCGRRRALVAASASAIGASGVCERRGDELPDVERARRHCGCSCQRSIPASRFPTKRTARRSRTARASCLAADRLLQRVHGRDSGSPDRGARRLVIGDGGETYYTDDHYASFTQIDPADYGQ